MLQGKTYWILGASEGLGRAIAIELDKAGASLILSARNQDRLEELANSLTDARALQLDVTDANSVARAAASASQADGMVYCAGFYEPMKATDWDDASAFSMVDVNFTGGLRVLGQVVPAFLKQGHGHIVLIGSLAGFRGLPGAIGYGASKAALMHLGENLYADLKDTPVRVQTINPGFITTRLSSKNDFPMPFIMSPEKAAARVVKAMQSGRFSTSFPAPFSWLFLLGRYLPLGLFHRLFR